MSANLVNELNLSADRKLQEVGQTSPSWLVWTKNQSEGEVQQDHFNKEYIFEEENLLQRFIRTELNTLKKEQHKNIIGY